MNCYIFIVYDHPTRTALLEKRKTRPVDNYYDTLRWERATMSRSLEPEAPYDIEMDE